MIILVSSLFAGVASAQREVRFEPDTVSVYRNPLTGWVMYLGRSWDDDFWTKQNYDAMPTSEGTTVRVSDYAGTAYIRTSWSSFEPEEGKYLWRDPSSRIYRLLKTVTDRGMRLAFRIVVDGRDQGQNTPLYVIDAGAEYFTSENGRHKTPFSDDPVFQAKYTKFLEALAEDFNDPDRVEFIDAFGLGKWGESHATAYRDPANKVKVFDWITALYSRTFSRVPLFIHYHRQVGDPNKTSWGEVAPETEMMLDIAIARGYSLRHDAFGMSGYYTEWETAYAGRWRYKLPIIMEGGWITAAHHRYWNDPSGRYREGHSEDVRRGEFDHARATHVNMMDFRINDEVRSWFGTSFDLVKRFVAEGGYRLYPDLVSAPIKARLGESVAVRSRWNNIGWGYCPTNIPQWNQKYKLAVALLDAAGNPACTVVDTHSDLSVWLKGAPETYLTEVKLDGLKPGRYTWALGLVDVTADNTPALEIAVDGRFKKNGWLTITTITIK